MADVGSGAGLPGLCLALARPDCQFLLIEPLERRVEWLDMVVADLGLENVDVIRGRAEQVSGNLDVDVVTARAVSALKTLVPLTMPMLQGAGELLAIKGRSAADEIAAARKVLRKYGGAEPEILTVGEGLLPTTTVVRVSARPADPSPTGTGRAAADPHTRDPGGRAAWRRSRRAGVGPGGPCARSGPAGPPRRAAPTSRSPRGSSVAV